MPDEEGLKRVLEMARQGFREQSTQEAGLRSSTTPPPNWRGVTLTSGVRDSQGVQSKSLGESGAESAEPSLVSSQAFRTGIGRKRV